MKFQRSSIWVVVALLLLLPAPAKADFIYTISFDAMMDSNGVQLWPADSFSFSVPSIITSAQIISMPPGTELNDIFFSELATSPVSGTLQFGSVHPPGTWFGSSFDFTPDTFPGGVGAYPSTNNAVYVYTTPCLGCGSIIDYYSGSGTLTITDTGGTAVPEPASLLLLGTGLFGLGRAWRKRRQ